MPYSQNYKPAAPPEWNLQNIDDARALVKALDHTSNIVDDRRVADMMKAISSNYSSGTSAVGVMSNVPENLQSMLYSETYSQKEFVFWNLIPKNKTFSLIDQATNITAFGDWEYLHTDFRALAPQSDPTWERKYIEIKAISCTGEVEGVFNTMQTIGTGNIVEQVTLANTTQIIRRAEHSLYDGDKSINSLEFDGLFPIIAAHANASDLIVNCKNGNTGGDLTLPRLQAGARVIRELGFGLANQLLTSPNQLAVLSDSMNQYGRFSIDRGAAAPNEAGFVFEKYRSQWETVSLTDDIFLAPMYYRASVEATGRGEDGKYPSPPASVTGSAGSHSSSEFVTSVDNGDYYYKVCACNKYGQSAPTATSAITVAAGDRVTLTINHAVGGPTPIWYKIYRTNKNGALGTEKLMFRVAAAASPGPTTVYDINAYLPGTTMSFLMQLGGPQNPLEFRQLGPYTRVPLAQIDQCTRWYQHLWGALFVHLPKRIVVFKNLA